MKLKSIIPAIATCLCSNVNAQGMPPGPPPDIIAITLDKSHDHELSAREIRNAERSLLKLDEDDDGALSAEELRPEPPRGRRREKKDDAGQNLPPAPPPSELMEAIDTDGNGELSKDELAKASENLNKLDTDEDRKVDHDEAPSLGDPDDERGGPPGGGGGGGRPPHPPGGPGGGRR